MVWLSDDRQKRCALSCGKSGILLVEIDILRCRVILRIGDWTGASNDGQNLMVDSATDARVLRVRAFPLLPGPSPPFLLLP